MVWSPEGRRRRGRQEIKREKEMEGILKQRNLTSDDAVNWPGMVSEKQEMVEHWQIKIDR
jgi:hypothetical protein